MFASLNLCSFSTSLLLNYILFMRLPTPGVALSSSSTPRKTVTLLRHGCSYMNEYLGGADGGTYFGAPGFTDVFIAAQAREKYHDAPLSPIGVRQVQRLDLDVNQFDVVLVSPLRRALQTYDQGVHNSSMGITSRVVPPVIAVPAAAERLYLVSDLGRPVADLQNKFPYVDFETYLGDQNKDCWWYQQQQQQQQAEWRPTGQGQRYACPGEPLKEFDERMSRLRAILVKRPEERILLVCHHGVIENLLGGVDFGNCEYRTVPVDQLLQKQERRVP